ncbi:hypothetical protein PAAG_12002 [Paracoccidioides lutzii Pb01]|uniref:Uncharacterized protein n=1 Tax=Paracoccidioides lutzii (strain ATCC MYA-826 / Pb01) TaxID=502779 RepID=A0A0A2V4N5_PARBA|nr:hypothetical protein PAAG_12002 [Paracoccidioides lutzii Pb01]KGQ01322.1 hypothetical protein PAAG_12002 [Paracoccidioides lutzii Pb01]
MPTIMLSKSSSLSIPVSTWTWALQRPLGDFHDSPITSGMGTMAYLSGQISKSTAGVAVDKIHGMPVLPKSWLYGTSIKQRNGPEDSRQNAKNYLTMLGRANARLGDCAVPGTHGAATAKSCRAVSRELAQEWAEADEQGMQNLIIVIDLLMILDHLSCLKSRKSMNLWNEIYIKGASAVFAYHILKDEKITVLSLATPDRFNPDSLTNSQAVEEPVLKGAIGGAAVSCIGMVHLTIKRAEDFCYQVWLTDETHPWIANFEHWRRRVLSKKQNLMVSQAEIFIQMETKVQNVSGPAKSLKEKKKVERKKEKKRKSEENRKKMTDDQRRFQSMKNRNKIAAGDSNQLQAN